MCNISCIYYETKSMVRRKLYSKHLCQPLAPIKYLIPKLWYVRYVGRKSEHGTPSADTCLFMKLREFISSLLCQESATRNKADSRSLLFPILAFIPVPSLPQFLRCYDYLHPEMSLEALWPMLLCPPHQSHKEKGPAGRGYSMLDFSKSPSEACPSSISKFHLQWEDESFEPPHRWKFNILTRDSGYISIDLRGQTRELRDHANKECQHRSKVPARMVPVYPVGFI